VPLGRTVGKIQMSSDPRDVRFERSILSAYVAIYISIRLRGRALLRAATTGRRASVGTYVGATL